MTLTSSISLTDCTFPFGDKVSAMNKIWQMATYNERTSLTLQQRLQLPEIICRLLSGRGLTLESTPTFLTPTLKALMPDPSHLKDMDIALTRIHQALQQGEKIAVFGDYDVDGATACAILQRYFADIGHPVIAYIPDRLKEGYGPNLQAFSALKAKEIKLVILVDCGTTSYEPLAQAAQMGLDVIVIDHHTAEAKLPQALALINPNRLDETSPLNHLCAAGLAFIVVVALQRYLRQQGWFNTKAEIDLRYYLDLVALGTVCDVMPLVGLNRAFVTQGLKVARLRKNLGLAALADVAGLTEPIGSYHLGFMIGPRVNAGGRVGTAYLGSHLLSSRDTTEVNHIARQLDSLNRERQALEAQVLEEAHTLILQQSLDQKPVLVVGSEGWHPGVIGIVASRLKDIYHRPTCVISFAHGLGKGSGRSLNGLNLGTAMHHACHQGLLINGGGHAMAAGFTVHQHLYGDFCTFLNRHFEEAMKTYQPQLLLEGSLALSGITDDLLGHLEPLEPFGNGNPTPKFLLKYVRLQTVLKVGLNHLKCQLIGEDGSTLKGMAFRADDNALGNFLKEMQGKSVHLAVTLKRDRWAGPQGVYCVIEDGMML